jgi:hypothetical protein
MISSLPQKVTMAFLRYAPVPSSRTGKAKIDETALRAKGPYVMAVNPSYGLRRARLAYPPD